MNQILEKKIKVPDVVIYMEGLLFQNRRWLKLPFNLQKFWWFVDTPVLFEQQIEWYKITDADFALVRDKKEMNRFEEHGIKCVWAPTKIDPDIYNIKYSGAREYDIGFVGYVSKTRYDWMEDFTLISDRVMAAGDSKLEHVPKFTYFYNGNKFPQSSLVDFYNRTKIVPHRTGRYEGTGYQCMGYQGDSTWRPFEATACGAMLLTEEFDSIDELFVRDKEVVVYDMNDDPKSRIELAQYYLEHDDEREKIAAEGYKRTMKDHVWKTISDLIEREEKKI